MLKKIVTHTIQVCFILPLAKMHGIAQRCTASHSIAWRRMASHSIARCRTASHGIALCHTAPHGSTMRCMALRSVPREKMQQLLTTQSSFGRLTDNFIPPKSCTTNGFAKYSYCTKKLMRTFHVPVDHVIWHNRRKHAY